MRSTQPTNFRWSIAAVDLAVEVDFSGQRSGFQDIPEADPAQVMAVAPAAFSGECDAAVN